MSLKIGKHAALSNGSAPDLQRPTDGEEIEMAEYDIDQSIKILAPDEKSV